MTRRRTILLCLLVLLTLPVSPAARDAVGGSEAVPVAAPEEVGMSAERLGRVTAAMQRYIDDEKVAGTVTLIARRGQVVHFEAQGWRDVSAKEPMTQNTTTTGSR